MFTPSLTVRTGGDGDDVHHGSMAQAAPEEGARHSRYFHRLFPLRDPTLHRGERDGSKQLWRELSLKAFQDNPR